ncbi:MAG TPA: carbohydrate kinase family protein [Methanocorpusculum sp.]|nr:carbohydrate kinase family protein [Methanocorpusculum sp.]
MRNLISVTGHLCNDYIITVEEYPSVGESQRVVNRENYFGGGAANIAVGIATLGGEAELIFAAGKDFPRSPYERHLQELGVKTTPFTSGKNCSTAFIVNTIAGDQITYFEWGAGEVFAAISAPKRKFVHMATGDAGFNIKTAKNADFASLDPGQDVKYYSKEQLEELFESIDLLICNNFELNIMQNTTGSSADEIRREVPMAIITEGKKGSTIYADGSKTLIPACEVKAVDPTGAGDAYRAGLFTAWKRGYDVETCCKVGSVVSSFSVEKIGTQTNLPTWEKMEQRFRTFFKGGLS